MFTVYAECGNHGVCDRVGGVCDCERGFKGDVCIDTLDSEVHAQTRPALHRNILRTHYCAYIPIFSVLNMNVFYLV